MNIIELKIYSHQLEEQIDFYSNTIGLKLIEKTDFDCRFQVGKSVLKLIKSDAFQPYHFAINIPSNKEEEALRWLKSRVEVLKDGEFEIQDFDFWNAKAVYFYDKDKNIVEFIARKNLSNESDDLFSSDSLLEISEIGVPVDDIEVTFNALNNISKIEQYDGGFERFCAIGNENGLFICINKHVKDWFPVGDKAFSSEFEIRFKENEKEHELEFKSGAIRELVK